MAPKRRSNAARTASANQSQQSTLSFNGKKSQITKQSAVEDAKAAKKEAALKDDAPVVAIEPQSALPEPATTGPAVEPAVEVPAPIEAEEDPLAPTTAGVKAEEVLGGRAEQSEVGAVGGKGSGWVADEEQQARKISETQIKKYWRQKEQERLAPRVHQEGLTVHEKILREWDMSNQYGPCIGIARLKRWKRANQLGLKPPIEVLSVLLKDLDDGNVKVQKAHVDELLTSRNIEP